MRERLLKVLKHLPKKPNNPPPKLRPAHNKQAISSLSSRE